MPCFRLCELKSQQTPATSLSTPAQQHPRAAERIQARRIAPFRPPVISRTRTDSYANNSSTVSELPIDTHNELALEVDSLESRATDAELSVLIDVLPARVQSLLGQRSLPSQVGLLTIWPMLCHAHSISHI